MRPASSLIEAVDHVDFQRFRVNERGTGSAQCEPRMTLAPPIHCYAGGIFSSRRIERAARRDIGVRFAAARLHPDRDTIARFRRENFDAAAECFLQALLPAREANVLEVGAVSVDGTGMDGSASKRRSATCARAGELIERLQGGIRELPARAEDAGRLPREIARREDLDRKLEEVRERLEREARQRAEAGRAGCERKAQAREARNGAGRAPQPPKKDWLRDMAGKLATDEGRDPFKLRERTAKPVFGLVKSVPGFRSFSLRGIGKVRGDRSPVAPARNCERLRVLQLAQAA